jgi:hypothetical protein
VSASRLLGLVAINTSSVTLLPTGVIALRASAGSADPAGIISTTLFVTLCSTTAAILAAKFFQRFFKVDASQTNPSSLDADTANPLIPEPQQDLPAAASTAYPAWVSYLTLLSIIAFVP